jgi:hypothetical protein
MLQYHVKLDDRKLKRLIKQYPQTVRRAAETALDNTAFEIRKVLREDMKRVFDRPTPYTLNSLQVIKTRNHNMRATVWFKKPERMGRHYLEYQVKGGGRRQKGFERALGRYFIPARDERRDRYGNLTSGLIRQILSVLGRAESAAGYTANISERSARTNKKQRDYVYLRRRRGSLPPGIYRRVKKGASGIGGKTKTKQGLEHSKAYQRGASRGSIVRARGLQPVMIAVNRPHYRGRLDFFGLAESTHEEVFSKFFQRNFLRFTSPTTPRNSTTKK